MDNATQARNGARTLGNQTGTGAGGIALGAALGFAAGALLANPARKLAMQGMEAVSSTDWVDALKKEHDLVRAAFQKLLQTREEDAVARKAMAVKIDYALTKHALEEEKVIYPALRRVDEARAQHLYADHADVKSLLGELLFELDAASPAWIERARALHESLDAHMREEEQEVFPSFRARMSQQQNMQLTKHMHMQGAMVA